MAVFNKGFVLLASFFMLGSVGVASSAAATGTENARAFRNGLRSNVRLSGGQAHSLAITPGAS